MRNLRLTPFPQVTIYSILGLIVCLLTWFNVWEDADIVRVANQPELISAPPPFFVAGRH